MRRKMLGLAIIIFLSLPGTLPVCADNTAPVTDLNGDGRVGMAEVIHILQRLTEPWDGQWPLPPDFEPGYFKGQVLAAGADGDRVPVPFARVGLVGFPGRLPLDRATDPAVDVAAIFPTPGTVVPGQVHLFWTLSDERGHFGFAQLPPGPYLAVALKPGWQEPLHPVTIAPGQTREGILLMLPALNPGQGTLFGQALVRAATTLTDVNHPFAGLPGAVVELSASTESPRPMRRTVADAEGRFHFYRLAIGEYVLSVQHPGYGTRQQPVLVTTGTWALFEANGTRPNLPPDGCVCLGPDGNWYMGITPIKVLMHPDNAPDWAALEGHVYAQQDDTASTNVLPPVAGARVTAIPYIPYPVMMPIPLHHTVSDETGHYRFDRLPLYPWVNTVPVYTIRFEAPGYKPFESRVTLRPGGETILDATLVPIGNTLATLSGHVFPAFLDCSIADCGGLPGVEMVLTGGINAVTNRAFQLRTRTDGRGYYKFSGIPAGEYGLTATKARYETWEGKVAIPAGQEVVRNLELLPLNTPTRLSGHVFDGSVRCSEPGIARCQMPVSGAELTLTSSFALDDGTMKSFQTLTDIQGAYAFDPIPAGRYLMTIKAEGFYPWNGAVGVVSGRDNVFNARIWRRVSDCAANDHCPPGTYCAKAPADCQGGGICEPIPQACYDLWAPVCGCDGQTYSNDCEAAAAGTSIAHEGECNNANN